MKAIDINYVSPASKDAALILPNSAQLSIICFRLAFFGFLVYTMSLENTF